MRHAQSPVRASMRLFRRRKNGYRHHHPNLVRLQIESLEDRLLLANWSGDVFDTAPGVPLWTNAEIQHVVGDIHVPADKTLTIQPGTVIQFDYGDINLTVDGTLNASGTAGSPIIFTSSYDNSPTGGSDTAGQGYWGSIEFGSSSTSNVMDHTEVRYGGWSLDSIVDTTAPLTLTNSVIRDSFHNGLRIVTANSTVTGNSFQNNKGAAISMDLASNPIISGSTLTSNGINGVGLDSGVLPADAAWNDPDIVYRLSGDVTVPQGTTLTIAAGQIVKFPYGDYNLIVNGMLSAVGTSASPIVFTSEYDDSAGGDTNSDGASSVNNGYWGSVQFGSTSTANVMDRTEVRYGGWSLDSIVDTTAPLTLTNSIVRNSFHNALRIVTANSTVTGIAFQNNIGAAVSMDLASNPTLTALTASNNGINGMLVDGGSLASDRTWNTLDFPYVLTGDVTIPQGRTLTVGAGQVIKSQLIAAGISLIVDGTLDARGTAARPIVFTSLRDDTAGGDTDNDGMSGGKRGDWSSIQFGSGSSGNLDHTEVRYGGWHPGLILDHGAIVTGGLLTLSNSIVRDSRTNGVFVSPSGSATLTSNLLVHNGIAGVQAQAGSALTAVNNTIDGNGGLDGGFGYGFLLDSPTATLTNNLITNNASVSDGAGIVQTGPTNLTMSFNNVFNPGRTNYRGLSDQTGMNGNISVDPKYFNPANLSYQLRPGSPVEDAGTSNGAPAIDFFGNPRFDDPNITGRGDGSGYDMGAIEVQQVATSNIDLATLNVNGPTTGAQGMTATINWTVKNVGSETATGSWSDAVYLSDTPVWTPDAKFLKRVEHTGDLAPDQSYDASTDVALNDVLPGNHYFIVRSNFLNEIFEGLAIANNAGASASPISFAMPTLTLNTPFDDQFTGAGQSKYYQITVAGGQTLSFSLQSSAGSGSTELYISRGTIPSRSQFDFGSGSALSPNQQVVLPTTQQGTYYVLAYAAYGSSASSAYTLTAGQPVFGVQSVSPATVGNSGQVTLTIQGALFTSQTQASLIAPDSSAIAAIGTRFVDATHLQATFDLSGKATGTYDVRVTQDAQTATAADALAVTTGAAGHLKVDFIVPGAIRAGRQGTVTVEYTNDGGADLPAPILAVTSNSPTLRFTTDANSRGDTAEFLAINPTGDAGVLPPGAHGSINLNFVATTDAGSDTLTFTLSSQSSLASGATLDWAAAKNNLRPPNVPADAWDAIYANFAADVGTTLGSFQGLLDRQATYLSRLGEYTGDEGRLMALEFQQAGDFGAIGQRYNLGAFGRGVPDPTVFTASANADGNVTILAGAQSRTFVIQPNHSYRGGNGDLAVLTLQNGSYRLQETDGTTTVFRTDGRFDFSQDTNGNRLTANYTGGQLTSYTDNFGNTTSLAYNAQGRISQITDPVGRVTSYTYDAAGQHLLSVATPQGTTQFTYVTGQGPQSEHAVQSIAYPDGTHSFFTYDSRGRLTKSTRDGGANELNYSYDGVGGTTVTNTLNHATTTMINEVGQTALTQDPVGNITRFFYDANHNLTQTILPDGSSGKITSDDRGNPTSAIDPLGQRIDATFDPVLNTLQTLRDARGNTLSFRSDSHGNPLSLTYPDGSLERFSYDAAGNVITKTDQLGNQTRFTYDAHNLLIREDFADGSQADFTYDAHRNLATATNSVGTTIYAYDAATDRLNQVTYPDGRYLKFAYDPAGRRTKSVDQDNFTVNYLFDSLGRLHRLTDGNGNAIATYTFDSVSRLQRQDLGNGTFTTYTYFANGRVKTLANHAPDGSVLSHFDYTYDALGRALTLTTADGVTSYGYDARGQLTSVALPGGRTISYQYDAAGNRISVLDNGSTTSYSTNNMNQYTAAGTAQFAYDADGNLIQRIDGNGTTTYGYNLQGQLASVTTPTDTYSYVYDAVGDRVAVVHNGVRTSYLVDPLGIGSVVGEYAGTGQLVAHYTQGAGLTSRVNANGAANYYAFDGTGNTSLITDPTGAVANRYTYLPFGETLSVVGSLPNAFTFGGQFGVMTDGNGLAYMRARYYDSGTGRFTAMDPIGSSGGLNLYAYAGNNPVDRADPLGTSAAAGLIEAILRTIAASDNYAILGNDAYNYARRAYENELRRFTKDQLINFARKRGVAAVTIEAYSAAEAEAAAAVVARQGARTLAVEGGGGGAAAGGGTVAVEAGGGVAAEGGGAAAGGGAAGGGGAGALAGPLGLALVGVVGATYAANRGAETGHSFNDAVADSFFNGEIKAGNKLLARAKELGFSGANDALITRLRELNGKTVEPTDPNDIFGPLGFGQHHFVTPDQTFPYTVLFENLPTATAPALVVKVTQQLDAKLDWTTFELSDFGFGKYIVHVPAGRRFYSTRVDASDTVGEFVDVTADFDPTTGQATWTFTSVDPATGALPEGATDGFLPPDDSAGSGEGFVTYRVRPTVGATTGTGVPAQARVFFDAGLADESFLDTPLFTNTFDDGAPESSVTALPDTTSNSNFQVLWSGSDDNAGSGIASYDIFMSDNGGPYVLWLDDTTNTSDTFSGDVGHAYSFFSIATDHVGHVEQKSPRAEAATKIVAGPAWQNPSKHEDVNNDTVVSPNDALRVINELNDPKVSAAGGRLPEVASPPPFLDVNGDGFVAPLDALIVINFLNNQAIGEGEVAWECVQPPVQVVPSPVTLGTNRNDVREGSNQRPVPPHEYLATVLQFLGHETADLDDAVSESGPCPDDTGSNQLWIKLVDEFFEKES